MEISKKNLLDESNHVQCECGNTTISEYSWESDDGIKYCPMCMAESMISTTAMYKKEMSFDRN